MVLLSITLRNNEDEIKFETHGILNKNKNTLIYDDNKIKTSIDFNNNIIKRKDKGSIITIDFNNEIMWFDFLSEQRQLTLKINTITMSKTPQKFEVVYSVENTDSIYYKVEILNL